MSDRIVRLNLGGDAIRDPGVAIGTGAGIGSQIVLKGREGSGLLLTDGPEIMFNRKLGQAPGLVLYLPGEGPATLRLADSTGHPVPIDSLRWPR